MMLDFADAGQEVEFKLVHQQMLPRTMQVASALACVVILASAVPTIVAERRRVAEDQLQFRMDDARTGWSLVCAGGLAASIFMGLYSTLAANAVLPKALDHVEVVSLLCTCHAASTVTFMNRWLVATIYGQDPAERWGGDVRASEGSVMLCAGIFITAVGLLVPIRVSRMWAVHVSTLLLHVLNSACFGSAFPHQTKTRGACIFVLVGLSYCGAWRSEGAARKQWQCLRRERHVVHVQQDEISRQQVEICESAALARGMQTVLTGLCDMVFKIGSGGEVLGRNSSRDNAFGCRMEGRALFDFFADAEECKRRFLGMLEASHDTGLLQMMRFTCVRRGGRGQEPFDAELLVVEMAGLDSAQRYLVGVRVLSEVFTQASGSSFGSGAAPGAKRTLASLPNIVPPAEPSEDSLLPCDDEWLDGRPWTPASVGREERPAVGKGVQPPCIVSLQVLPPGPPDVGALELPGSEQCVPRCSV